MPAASIYLDNNSTTPIDPRVVEAMSRTWRECGANPSSQHALGRKARRVLEDAREGIADLLGAKTSGMDADQLIFTSGGTEANNLAVLGLSSIPTAGTKPCPGMGSELRSALVISAIEHPSIMAAAEELRRRGGLVQVLPVNVEGAVEIRRQEISRHISVMLANNETGVIQPVTDIAKDCRERGVSMHTDAVQAVGKIGVNFRELGVDAMTVAPHKFHGPLGIGALVLRHGVTLRPLLFGGFQQAGIRPGTENVALAVGFHEALRLAVAELAERGATMRTLRDELERSLRAALANIVIIGEHARRLPNTSCASFPGVDRQALVMALDLAGVACSTGSACASGSSEPSPTLLAMELPQDVIGGAIRLSLGAFTTAADVAEAARRIVKTVMHLRAEK
ncbi:MAG TPA: cysteine desulfurase family protein [Pirellulaceae bacterium]|nr:cysteine desulfurase family protein [Pirellulaceae bacterium]